MILLTSSRNPLRCMIIDSALVANIDLDLPCALWLRLLRSMEIFGVIIIPRIAGWWRWLSSTTLDAHFIIEIGCRSSLAKRPCACT